MFQKTKTQLLAVAIAVLLAGFAEACPTCKEAVSENGGNLVQGYFWSIVFMMSMPFLIVAGLGTMFYLDVRRARRLQAERVAPELAASAASA